EQYRESRDSKGHEPERAKMGVTIPISGPDSNEKARRDFEPSLWYFAKKLLKGIDISPPGYTSVKSAISILKNREKFLAYVDTWKQVEDGMFAIVGSPETVREKLCYFHEQLGAGNICTGCQIGALSHEQTRRSMKLLAEEVIPYVRQAEGSPVRA